MPKIAEIVANPAVHFSEPAKLAEEQKLTTEEKRQALATWEKDAEALDVATDEGMAPVDDEVPVQDLVREAQTVVEAESDASDDVEIDPERRVKL
jgi:hypothetical protein